MGDSPFCGVTPILQRLRKKARKLAKKTATNVGLQTRSQERTDSSQKTYPSKRKKKLSGRSKLLPATLDLPSNLGINSPTTTDKISSNPELNMEELIKQMKMLHSQTERSVKQMVEDCKSEINKNLNTKVNLL